MNGQARARKLVSAAIAAGTLVRPAMCEGCGRAPKRADRAPLDAHHITYSRPLDVTWLCPSCHRLAHPRRPPASPADAELLRDPARSDRLIAALTGVEHHAVSRARQRLEQAGEIPRIPIRARVPRYPNGPRALGKAASAVARLPSTATTREIMNAARVSREAAWHARMHPRDPAGALPVPVADAAAAADAIAAAVTAPLADAAAATDALSVVKTPAPRIDYKRVTDRPSAPFYLPPDDVLDLPCCTATYTATGWQHDRACALRLAARS